MQYMQMKKNLHTALLCFMCAMTFSASAAVSIDQLDNGDYQLIADKKPYVVNGVGGTKHLEILKELGGNTIRTWGIEELEQKIEGKLLLDYAESIGIKVVVGLWLGHERHGFDYNKYEQLMKQRDDIRRAVKKYRNHPALLIWGLGNEMEGPQGSANEIIIWEELNQLAKIIKKEDSDHPIMTIVAGIGGDKVSRIKEHYPEIDILGVNAYASAAGVSEGLLSQGWDKPFMLTEFGPLGHWEVAKAPWGAPIEPTSQNKASDYYVTHKRTMTESNGQCIGSFAFLWDFKQEMTETWYGMFLKTGERLGSVDAMSYAWTGSFPENRAPKLLSIDSPAYLQYIEAGSEQKASVTVTDPEGDPLKYRWVVIAETSDSRVGGDAEKAPPEFPKLTRMSKGSEINFTAPSKSGPYRLFVFVTDSSNGAATANFPFYVN